MRGNWAVSLTGGNEEKPNMKRRQYWVLSFFLICLITFGCRWSQPVDDRPAVVPSPTAALAEVPVTAGDVFSLVAGANFGFASYPVAEGGKIVMQFTIESDGSNDVIFSVRDQRGNYVRGPEKVYSGDSFVYTQQFPGSFQLWWDNSFDGSNDKLVRWNYTAYPPGQ